MKINKIFLVSLILLTIIAVGAVSAADTQDNTTDAMSLDEDTDLQISDKDIISNSEKQNYNISVEYEKEIVKGDTTSYISFKNPTNAAPNPISYYVDGKFYKNSTMDWTYEGDGVQVMPSNLALGNHVVTISFPGNEYYNTQNLECNIKIVPYKLIIPDMIDLTDSPQYVEVQSAKDVTGSVIVKINGTQFKKESLQYDDYFKINYASIELTHLNPGPYEIELIYSGNDKYAKKSVKKNIEVDYRIIPLHYSSGYESSIETEVCLPEDVKNNPFITLDGKNYTHTGLRYPGWFEFKINGLPAGSYNGSITYPGDDKYIAKTINTTFEVKSRVYFKSMSYYGDGSGAILIAPADAKGNLTVYVDNELYKTVPATNGLAKIVLDLPIHNQYRIRAEYDGDDYEILKREFGHIVFPKLDYNTGLLYGNKETIKIEVPQDIEANLSYTFNKKEYFPLEITDGKSNFTIDSKNYKPGVSVYFYIKYNDDEFEGYVYMIEHPYKISSGKDITMFYGDSNTYAIKVYGKDGEIIGADHNVKITIGSKTYKVKTDKNGVAKLKISELPGKYTITAIYKDAELKNKLIVKQTLSLKAVSVKKSAKKLTLQATLKNKKAIKNKQVTFKFNGKTYKAKTNSKGIAKVTIPKSVLSKLKVGKKITYQATYLKDTVKKTVKVKK